MLQNSRKTLGFKKNMVYKIPPGGGGKPYPASGLNNIIKSRGKFLWQHGNCTSEHLLSLFVIYTLEFELTTWRIIPLQYSRQW